MSHSIPDMCDEFADRIQVLEPLFTDFGARRRFSGEIVTVKCFEDNTVVKQTLAEDGTGKVMVVDGGGSRRCALLGDLLAAMAHENGWQGVVIFGCARDVQIVAGIDLGVRALAAYPVRSTRRGEGQLNIPVAFAGARIEPGQHLYADENGMIVADSPLPVEFKN